MNAEGGRITVNPIKTYTLEEIRTKTFEKRNHIKNCPACGTNIEDRKIALHKGLIDALYRVYCWCGKNKKHEFETKEIRDLLGKNEYARFGDFVRMGGIIYRPKDKDGKRHKASYGMNMERAREFFHGERDIPIQITLNQINGEIIDEVRGKVGEFPDLKRFLTKDGLYDHRLDVMSLFDSR